MTLWSRSPARSDPGPGHSPTPEEITGEIGNENTERFATAARA